CRFTGTISFLFFLIAQRPTRCTLFPYTTLFRSRHDLRQDRAHGRARRQRACRGLQRQWRRPDDLSGLSVRPQTPGHAGATLRVRSEEHTSELQSRENLVCRLLLEKKNEIKAYSE